MLRSLLLKNKDTGEIIQVSGWRVNRQYALPPLVYSEKEWELVYQVNDYARVRKNEQNWGAYILPERVGIGERLYIADLIEDVMANAFWGTVWYAADGIAEWNGTDLIIDLHEYDRFQMIG